MLTISVNSTSHNKAQDLSQDEPGNPTLPFLVFKVSAHLYAVNLLQLREVRTTALLTRVAHAPSYVAGVTSIRGEIVPVIDMKERFRLERNELEPRKGLILVSEMNSRKVGIQVDAIMEIMDIDLSKVQSVPRTTMAIDLKYLNGMAQVDGQIILLIDLQKILQPEELHALHQSTEEEAVV
jgi:purine-binding chemotaxis protein CheW